MKVEAVVLKPMWVGDGKQGINPIEIETKFMHFTHSELALS